MSQQKRRAPRVPIELRVEYKRVNAFIADFTRDVSGQGLFVRTDEPLPLDSECLFTLSVPKMPGTLTLRGMVRRVVPPGGAEEAGMGVEVVFEDDEERQALRQLIDDLMVEHLGANLFGKMLKLRG